MFISGETIPSLFCTVAASVAVQTQVQSEVSGGSHDDNNDAYFAKVSDFALLLPLAVQCCSVVNYYSLMY